MIENLETLSDICRAMRGEIKAPVDELIEDALFAILQELREINQWRAENQKNWTGI